MGHDDVARRLQERMEQEAVRTTIVGGRPPGSGQSVGAVPRGVEVLLKKAAVDGAFRAELLSDRAKAAERLGMPMTAGEKMMLRAVSDEQLSRMIGQTKVPESAVGALMGQAAAVMLAALGLVQITGCDQGVYSAGVRPADRGTPPNTQSQPGSAAAPSTMNTGPATGTASAPSPQGIRPDTPPMLTKGIRPDVPVETLPSPATRGVRPDVPPTKPSPTQPASQVGGKSPDTFQAPAVIIFGGTIDIPGERRSVEPATQTQPATEPATQTKPATQPVVPPPEMRPMAGVRRD